MKTTKSKPSGYQHKVSNGEEKSESALKSNLTSVQCRLHREKLILTQTDPAAGKCERGLAAADWHGDRTGR